MLLFARTPKDSFLGSKSTFLPYLDVTADKTALSTFRHRIPVAADFYASMKHRRRAFMKSRQRAR